MAPHQNSIKRGQSEVDVFPDWPQSLGGMAARETGVSRTLWEGQHRDEVAESDTCTRLCGGGMFLIYNM